MTEPIAASDYYALDYEDFKISYAPFKLDYAALPRNSTRFKLDFEKGPPQFRYYKIDFDRLHTIYAKLDYQTPASDYWKIDYADQAIFDTHFSLDYEHQTKTKFNPNARVISFRWG